MNNHTMTIDFAPLVEDSFPDPRIKKAELLCDSASRLDSQQMKYTPMCDASIPFRDRKVFTNLLRN